MPSASFLRRFLRFLRVEALAAPSMTERCAFSSDWPTTPVTGGQTITVDFWATTPHDPSVWDVWMTTPDWDANTALNWDQMEFLGRPDPVLANSHYTFDLDIPGDRSGHHLLWIAWQRDDPVGEVFFTSADLMITSVPEPATGLLAGLAMMFCMFRRRRVPARVSSKPRGNEARVVR